MSTLEQKATAFSVTRLIIFVLGVLSVLVEGALADVLAILAMALWLWLPNVIHLELYLIDRYLNRE